MRRHIPSLRSPLPFSCIPQIVRLYEGTPACSIGWWSRQCSPTMAPFQMVAESLFRAQESHSRTLLRIPDHFAIHHTILPHCTTRLWGPSLRCAGSIMCSQNLCSCCHWQQGSKAVSPFSGEGGGDFLVVGSALEGAQANDEPFEESPIK